MDDDLKPILKDMRDSLRKLTLEQERYGGARRDYQIHGRLLNHTSGLCRRRSDQLGHIGSFFQVGSSNFSAPPEMRCAGPVRCKAPAKRGF
jgi:hypothetical protein